MTDARHRTMRSLKLFRVLRWVMLVVGCADVIFGLSEIGTSFTVPGVLNLFLGVIFIATGVMYFVVVRQLRRRMAEHDASPPS